MSNTYKQGDRVKYDMGDLSGFGIIVGVSTIGLPVIGATYIIEPDEPLDPNVYPYSHFVLPEVYLLLAL